MAACADVCTSDEARPWLAHLIRTLAHGEWDSEPRPSQMSARPIGHPLRPVPPGEAYLSDVITRIVQGHQKSHLGELLRWVYRPSPTLAV